MKFDKIFNTPYTHFKFQNTLGSNNLTDREIWHKQLRNK